MSAGQLPDGLSLNALDGVLSGTPTSPGQSLFSIQVTDAAENSTVAEYSLLVVSNPPVITTQSLPQGSLGSSYSVQLAATGDGPPFTWTLAGGALPPGIDLGEQGELTGTPSAAGHYAPLVQVTDAYGQVAQQEFLLVVTADSPWIITESLPDASAGVPYSSRLDATGGFPPYTWWIASGGLPPGLYLDAGGDILGTPDTPGLFGFDAIVFDIYGQADQQALSILVQGAPLTITTAQLPQGTVGQSYAARIEVSGGYPPFAWSVTEGVLPPGLVLYENGEISGLPLEAGTAAFTIRVRDSHSAEVSRPLSITIVPNTLAITTAALPVGSVGHPYEFTLAASGGVLPYGWHVFSGPLPPGLRLDSLGTIFGTPTQAGAWPIPVRVVDAIGQSADRAFELIIEPDPPVIQEPTLPPGTIGVAYVFQLSAQGGSPPYSWSLVSGSLPAGMAVEGDGSLTGIPEVAGSFPLTVRATDFYGQTGERAYVLEIATAPPVILTESLADGAVGAPYESTFAATGGFPPYSWWVSSGSLPPGLGLGPDGVLGGTPLRGGVFAFSIRVSDLYSQTAERAYTLTILGSDLQILTTELPVGTLAQPYTAALEATGGAPGYQWSLTEGELPTGLALDTNGVIEGTPEAAGIWIFTVQVQDTAATTDTAVLGLRIQGEPPTILTSSLPPGAVGEPYSADVVATGGTPPYSWWVGSGSLPAGLTLDEAGHLSGAPAESGEFGITVWVADSIGEMDDQALTLSVAPGIVQITTTSLPPATVGQEYSALLEATGGTPPYAWIVDQGSLPAGIALDTGGLFTLTVVPDPPVIVTDDLAPGAVGSPYAQTLQATGGVQPYSWWVADGSLPPGLALSPEGELSGAPERPGDYAVRISVSDAFGQHSSRDYTLSVQDTGLIIVTESLPDGTVDSEYDAGLEAEGGSPPYWWSVAGEPGGPGFQSAGAPGSGAGGWLPPGLRVRNGEGGGYTGRTHSLPVGEPGASAAVVGIPEEAGEFSFTLLVTDSRGQTAQRPYTMAVHPALEIVVTQPPAPPYWAVLSQPYSMQVVVQGGAPSGSCTWQCSGLPGGLTFTPSGSTGSVAGAPNALGSYSVTFSVAQTTLAGYQAQASKTITLHVVPDGGVHIVQPAPGANGARANLPDGTVNRAYPPGGSSGLPLEAVGGVQPYSWQVEGGLPPGLQVSEVPAGSGNWRLGGSPTQTGTFDFNLRVRDAAYGTESKPYRIVVTVVATWYVDTAIQNAALLAPAAGIRVATLDRVPCEAREAQDSDKKDTGGAKTTVADEITYRWTATGGSFENASERRATWIAPARQGNYTLRLTVEDQNDANKPAGDLGTRNDPAVLFSVQVTVLPYLIELAGATPHHVVYRPYIANPPALQPAALDTVAPPETAPSSDGGFSPGEQEDGGGDIQTPESPDPLGTLPGPTFYEAPRNAALENPSIQFGVHLIGYQDWDGWLLIYPASTGNLSDGEPEPILKRRLNGATSFTWDQLFGTEKPGPGVYAWDVQLEGKRWPNEPPAGDRTIGLSGSAATYTRLSPSERFASFQVNASPNASASQPVYTIGLEIRPDTSAPRMVDWVDVKILNPQMELEGTVRMSPISINWWQGTWSPSITQPQDMGNWTLVADAQVKRSGDNDRRGVVVPEAAQVVTHHPPLVDEIALGFEGTRPGSSEYGPPAPVPLVPASHDPYSGWSVTLRAFLRIRQGTHVAWYSDQALTRDQLRRVAWIYRSGRAVTELGLGGTIPPDQLTQVRVQALGAVGSRLGLRVTWLPFRYEVMEAQGDVPYTYTVTEDGVQRTETGYGTRRWYGLTNLQVGVGPASGTSVALPSYTGLVWWGAKAQWSQVVTSGARARTDHVAWCLPTPRAGKRHFVAGAGTGDTELQWDQATRQWISVSGDARYVWSIPGSPRPRRAKLWSPTPMVWHCRIAVRSPVGRVTFHANDPYFNPAARNSQAFREKQGDFNATLIEWAKSWANPLSSRAGSPYSWAGCTFGGKVSGSFEDRTFSARKGSAIRTDPVGAIPALRGLYSRSPAGSPGYGTDCQGLVQGACYLASRFQLPQGRNSCSGLRAAANRGTGVELVEVPNWAHVRQGDFFVNGGHVIYVDVRVPAEGPLTSITSIESSGDEHGVIRGDWPVLRLRGGQRRRNPYMAVRWIPRGSWQKDLTWLPDR